MAGTVHTLLERPSRTAGASGRRQPKSTRFILTPACERLLQGVWTYHLVTAAQLTRRFYRPGTLTTVKARLKLLVDQHYLLTMSLPTITGRSPLLYALARKGRAYLQEAGLAVRGYFRPSSETSHGRLFLEHTLAVNDVLIAAALLPAQAPEYTLVRQRHERDLKHTPVRVAVSQPGTTEPLAVVPDGFIEFAHTEGQQLPLLLELDRGTEEQWPFRRKLRGYIELLRSGQYKAAFGLSQSVLVAFATTAGQGRLEQLRRFARKELALTGEPGWLAHLLRFTALPTASDAALDPQTLFLLPIWLTPFDAVPGQPQPIPLLSV